MAGNKKTAFSGRFFIAIPVSGWGCMLKGSSDVRTNTTFGFGNSQGLATIGIVRF
ncbi:hypothetical protein [Pseudomonas proteolytica]|uniref:hypothetical protein n=1 Tax=Pseudomonas proteolytica TaxID=219574 RepID=UPI0014735C81|nr:hypothetical protein [Pseudomonas proteolytica]NMZ42963.1 hypothetical protein [Pseudomonas proteolytica]